jgi:hypothetical protein
MCSWLFLPAWLSRITWSICEERKRRSFLRMVSGEPIRPPRSAASCASGFSRFHLLYSSHMLTVPGAGRWRFCDWP